MTESPWMDSDQAAAYAGVSPNTIRDAAASGELDGCKITPGSKRSRWKFRATDVDAWLERGRVAGGVGRPRRRRRVA